RLSSQSLTGGERFNIGGTQRSIDDFLTTLRRGAPRPTPRALECVYHLSARGDCTCRSSTKGRREASDEVQNSVRTNIAGYLRYIVWNLTEGIPALNGPVFETP